MVRPSVQSRQTQPVRHLSSNKSGESPVLLSIRERSRPELSGRTPLPVWVVPRLLVLILAADHFSALQCTVSPFCIQIRLTGGHYRHSVGSGEPIKEPVRSANGHTNRPPKARHYLLGQLRLFISVFQPFC